MNGRPVILDQHGNALAPVRRLAGVGSLTTPYHAADFRSQETAGWQPWLASPDTGRNPYRDIMVARIRDLVRNDGWASAAVTRTVDDAIGADFRLLAKPDWRMLRLFASGFDAVWADEFGRTVEAYWRDWTNDPGRYCDQERRLSFGQMQQLGFRTKLIDGEALALLPWLPERMGPGRASCATAVQLISPDRLSNPQMAFDSRTMRGGCELDALGVTIAYHLREAHPSDWFDAGKSWSWTRIPRETSDGRANVVHDFDAEEVGQHRGAGGIFTPIVARLRMISQYDATELAAAVVNATLAAFIESPNDPELVQDAMQGGALSDYQAARAEFHDERRLALNGVRIPIMFPGEKLNTVTASRPSAAYEPFQAAALRNIAAAIGSSYEQLSTDWSRSNYSSARGAVVTAWKTLTRRRHDFARGFSSPIYAAWLEELFDRRALPLPDGAPDFLDARAAYSACRWMGPARGWIDPVKERQGAVLSMDSGLSTLEQECFEQGVDWEEQLEQRAIEVKRFRDLGLPLPQWAGEPAEQAALKPAKEQPA